MLIVLTSILSADDAATLAAKIVNAKLAACVQILPQMTSIYVWEGKLQKEHEHLLMIKTLREKYEELREFIVANHSYTVAEIVAIDVDKVSGRYLAWMKEVISG